MANLTKAPDAVKLFVGQIPKSMDEEQLKRIFGEVGNVFELSVIKDRVTGASRGCCFLTYCTRAEADKAIHVFNGARTLPPMSNPLQVKYAEGELERLEHKIFIGMLPKSATEDQVRALVAPYGTIVDLTLLKQNNVSKGCAFLKYETRESANACITALNGQQRLEGSTLPLVVKFADTDKEKAARRMQKQQTLMIAGGLPGMPGMPSMPGMPGMPGMPMGFPGYPGYSATPTYPQMAAATPAVMRPPMGALPGQAGAGMNAMGAMGMMPGLGGMAGVGGMTGAAGLAGSPAGVAASPYGTPAAAAAGMYPGYYPGYGAAIGTAGAAGGVLASPQVEGPPGSNLFIYHIPQEFTDPDLKTTFSPFGNVVSAKVFVDKNTGISKCFGFVSFDNAASAQAAIQTMNGFAIGGKRLKVQLKREGGGGGKPY
eukprot:jgi/Mesvir1/11952/Mv00280-RA.1